MTKKTIGALVVLLAFALLVAACGGGGGTGTTTTTGATTTTGGGGPQAGGTYRIETPGIDYTGGGDPTGEYLGLAWGILSNLTSRTLLTVYHTNGAKGNSLVPDLATAMPTVSSDGLTYTFTLKDGVKFGPPLSRAITSADVKYAFRRLATAAISAQYGGYYYGLIEGMETPVADAPMPADISGIETPDDKTIVFHLTRNDPSFLFLVSLPATTPMPEEVAGCFMEANTYGRYLVSSGPYMYEGSEALDPSSCDALIASGPIAGFNPESHSYFVRNPDYDPATDSVEVRANYVDKITIDLNTNEQDIYAKIKAGELDGAVGSGNPPADVLQAYATDPALQPLLKSYLDDRTMYIFMNLDVPPFDDIHLRKAVNLIMDKAGIQQAWGGDISGVIATHIQPPGMAGLGQEYDPYATPNFAGDLALAQAEMKQSKYDTNADGMCDAPECSGVILVNRVTSPWTEAEPVVVSSLAKIGITVEVRELENHYPTIQTPSNLIPIGMDPGWGKDYPDSSSFEGFLFDGRLIIPAGNTNYSLVGLTQAMATELGIPFTPGIPSVDSDIDNCKLLEATSAQGALDCWNNLDKKLMEEVVPWVPYLWIRVITVIGPAVTSWDYDQMAGTTAFSKLAVDPSLQK